MATADMRELGSTGLERYGGVVQEEYLRELQGDRWNKTVAEMQQDPVIGATLLAIEMLLREADWNVEPADDSPEAAELAEFVEGCLGDMSLSWEDTLAEILTMLSYGWSYLELVYKRRAGDNRDPKRRSKFEDGKIGWRKWAIRAQDTLAEWEFGDDGGAQGMEQYREGHFGRTVSIPIDKALLFRTTAHKGNPEGKSLLRGCYRPWYFKQNIENIEGIGIERDLAGLPVAYAPPEIMSSDATASQTALFNTLKEIVTNIRRDEQEGVVFPLVYDDAGHRLFELTLLSTGGQRQFDIDKVITRYNAQIAMRMLADFIVLGHEKVGSYALSATKASLFKTALRGWLKAIADVINRFAIARLLKLNGMNTKLAPVFVFGAVGEVELEDITALIEAIGKAGGQLFPSFELENHLRGLVGFPLLDKSEMDAEPEASDSEAEDETPEDEDDMSEAEMAAMLAAAQRILARGG